MNKGSGKNRTLREIVGSMNNNTIGILVCVAVLIITLIVFFAVRGNNSHDGKKENNPTSSSEVEAASQIGDSDTTDVTTDTEENEVWQSMSDDDYSVTISAFRDGYSGDYLEDGSDEKVKNILSLRFTNNGSQAIQYGEYVFSANKDVVVFKFSNLPAGQSCVVLEAGKHEFSKKEVLNLESRVVAQVDELPFAREQVLLVDNSDDTITIMNLTDKEIPSVRAFYKTFDEEKNEFVGGITYTAKAENIPVGGGVTVAPAHYHSGRSKIVGSGVYEAEG